MDAVLWKQSIKFKQLLAETVRNLVQNILFGNYLKNHDVNTRFLKGTTNYVCYLLSYLEDFYFSNFLQNL